MWKTWITSNAFQIRESKYRSHGRYLICIGFSFSFLCFSTFSSSFQVVLDLKKKSLCPLPKFPTIYSWGSKSTKNNEMLLGLQLLSMLSREPASVGKATPSKWMPETSLTLTFASVHQKKHSTPAFSDGTGSSGFAFFLTTNSGLRISLPRNPLGFHHVLQAPQFDCKSSGGTKLPEMRLSARLPYLLHWNWGLFKVWLWP